MDFPVNRDFLSTGKERIKIHITETAINLKRYGQRTTIVIHELFLSARLCPKRFFTINAEIVCGYTRLSPCSLQNRRISGASAIHERA